MSRFYRIFFLALSAIFCAEFLFAEEISPSWEGVALKAHFDRAAAEGVLPANAFCSAEYLVQSARRRREARVMLEEAFVRRSANSRVWAQIFESAAARSIAGMSQYENELVVAAKCSVLFDVDEGADFGKNNGPKVREAAGGIIALPFSKSNPKIVRHGRRLDAKSVCTHLNLRLYSLRGVKYDAFRLYLYIESVTDAELEHFETTFGGQSHFSRTVLTCRYSSYQIQHFNIFSPLSISRSDISRRLSCVVSKKSIADIFTRFGGFV